MQAATLLQEAPESATRMWAAVSEHLEAYARAWEEGGPPADAGRFVPAGPAEVRALVLVELVKFDLDQRLQRGLDRPLEDYLREFPELAAGGGPPCDLLYEDFHLRRRAGRAAEPADYYRRFPTRAAELARLLGGGTTGPDETRSTAMFPARAPAGLNPGDQLDDFDLLARLGEGQFAQVFLARQRSMQRLVALKVSAHRGAEAQTLAQLDHPHIVRVYDQRVLADRGMQLVYMPCLPGGTLQDVTAFARKVPAEARSGRTLLQAVDAALARRGEVPPPTSPVREAWAERSWPAVVCAIGAKLAAALDYAHRHGVLHRDVKPANVLLTAEGEPMLADFNVGCCSKLDGAGPAAFFGGSLAYMAAEHLEAFDPANARPPESLDGRADVFGLAVTLWELATGERPFGVEPLYADWRRTLAALLELRRAGPTPAAVAAFPEGDVPGLREVLLRCLDPDPARRPATAGELARELELCLRPATRDLVRPAPGGWRGFVRRHPILAIYPLTVGINALASWFNVVYNREEIIDHWGEDGTAKRFFAEIVPVINGIMFPLAMIAVAVAIWPVVRGLRRMREGNPPARAELAGLRRQALEMGAVIAWVCVAAWMVAGVIWPTALRAAAGPPPQGPGVYLHFLVSLVICGLIAAAYPYFFITFLAVRVYYPSLLGPDGPAPSDGPALRRVGRELGWYRAAAAGVPLLAVLLRASVGGEASAIAKAAPIVAAVAGLAGVAVAYFIETRTRADLAALAEIPASDRPSAGGA